MTGDGIKIQCCKEQYCIGAWNVRSTNQGKLEVVKEKMARVNIDILGISSIQFICWVMFNSATPWTAARQATLSITNSQSLPKPMFIKSVMPFNHLILVPFSSCPQSLPASGSFPMSWLFASGGQSIGVSASTSVPPMTPRTDLL